MIIFIFQSSDGSEAGSHAKRPRLEDVSLSASESQSGKKSANFRPWSERDDVSAAEAAARAATAAAAETARRGHYYHSKCNLKLILILKMCSNEQFMEKAHY